MIPFRFVLKRPIRNKHGLWTVVSQENPIVYEEQNYVSRNEFHKRGLLYTRKPTILLAFDCSYVSTCSFASALKDINKRYGDYNVVALDTRVGTSEVAHKVDKMGNPKYRNINWDSVTEYLEYINRDSSGVFKVPFETAKLAHVILSTLAHVRTETRLPLCEYFMRTPGAWADLNDDIQLHLLRKTADKLSMSLDVVPAIMTLDKKMVNKASSMGIRNLTD